MFQRPFANSVWSTSQRQNLCWVFLPSREKTLNFLDCLPCSCIMLEPVRVLSCVMRTVPLWSNSREEPARTERKIYFFSHSLKDFHLESLAPSCLCSRWNRHDGDRCTWQSRTLHGGQETVAQDKTQSEDMTPGSCLLYLGSRTTRNSAARWGPWFQCRTLCGVGNTSF